MKDKNYLQAIDVAYVDVKASFQHYLDNHNKGRPIIISGHSQGALLAERLIKEFFHNKPLSKQLVAGYLLGWTIFDKDFKGTGKNDVKICKVYYHHAYTHTDHRNHPTCSVWLVIDRTVSEATLKGFSTFPHPPLSTSPSA